MSDLLSHLSDELCNDGHISVRRKADGNLTVDLYRYRIASFYSTSTLSVPMRCGLWKKTRLEHTATE